MDPAVAIELAAKSDQQFLLETIMKKNSNIQKYYDNCTVFITGGTGFLGKQLIEKLFRACNISKIYVLTRSKKGKILKERIHEMLQDPVFEIVRKQNPKFESKLVPLAGDVAEIRLGLSDKNWKTITEEVNVMYHLAATTRFDETLWVATLINVRGTREVLLLAKDCRKLKSFVHVSTAYNQAVASLIDQEVFEEFAASPIPPDTLISMAEKMDLERFNGITSSLITDWPNTYTFTKAVSEDLIRTMSDGLPICIVRPGIVTATYREPKPGWLDMSCAYGATGFILGVGLGVLHVAMYNRKCKLGLVPCDYVNNTIIAAATVANRSFSGENTKIYVCSSTKRNVVLQAKLPDTLHDNRSNLSCPNAVYYNYGFQTTSQIVFTAMTWFLHFIPAYLIDFICLLLGKKRRLVHIYTKVYRMSTVMSYFSVNSWIFNDKNTEYLFNSLSETDKFIFNFDVTKMDWTEYILLWCIGVRKYIIKDGLKDTVKATRKQAWLKLIHYTLSALYFYCIWKILCFTFYIFNSGLSLLAFFYCDRN